MTAAERQTERVRLGLLVVGRHIEHDPTAAGAAKALGLDFDSLSNPTEGLSTIELLPALVAELDATEITRTKLG
jgi:microsomal dipeptidase-like Zn-dependent dipeptidase